MRTLRQYRMTESGIGMEIWHLWESPALPFNRREILRYAGEPGAQGDASLPLEEILRAAASVRCRAVWRRYPIVREAGGILNLGFLRTESRAVNRFLRSCDETVLFALTAGVEMDRIIARESLRSPLRGLLAHAAGAERTETACDALTRDVLAALPGREAVGRFSPGYGDLPLAVQQNVLEALPAGRLLGITLNDAQIMSPSKSVTALIGLKYREGSDTDDPAGAAEGPGTDPVL